MCMNKKTLFRLGRTGKIVLAICVSSCVYISSYSQQSSDTVATRIEEGTISDLPAKPFRMPSLSDVGGSSPFLSSEYRLGSVELGQGRVVNNVPLKFNSFNNALMVQRDGQELKLEFFEFAYYTDVDGNGGTKQFMFKGGYPEINGHNENAIYQVLSMGPKVHLLKFIAQKVEDMPTLGDYSRREIVTTEEFYVYVVGGEMKKIKSLKSGKQSLQEALPEFSSKIDEISIARKLKLKTESEISIVVEELNKP